jgi:SOUL heme-binding protein
MKMKVRKMWLVAGVAIIVAGAGAWWSQVSRVEEPKYLSVETQGAIEIRDYPELIAAEATVKGDRSEAIRQGFGLIADYIFGNNSTAGKVAMTAPVTQQASEKIAMTAPVTQQGAGNEWTVRFIMPSNYTMESLPTPNKPDVKLVKQAAKRQAVIRFSGVADEAMLANKTAELTRFIAEKKLSALSAPTYAFYNPPWTLGVFRRNEVMIEVER